MDNKIKVGVRIRPLNDKELIENSTPAIFSQDGKYIVTNRIASKKNSFDYDWAFDTATSNRDLYIEACRPLIDKVYDGFNATFFAYGQTSSGKTYTLGGADMSEGVIPFALQDIFDRRNDLLAVGTKVDIELSYIEIYREECFDLLAAAAYASLSENTSTAHGNTTGGRIRLELKESSAGKTMLDGLCCQPVQDVATVMNYLRNAAKARSTGQTAMNAQSSRSHSICTLNLCISRDTGVVTSQLHLVDLAGSERQKKTQAKGDRLKEGISINRGLLALGNVVSALATQSMLLNGATNETGGGTSSSQQQQQHIHVPYRESKLTRLLKDALGGNGLTVMLACVSPAESNAEETINTLRFASRASSIVNRARVNHSTDAADTVGMLKEIHSLRTQLTRLQQQQQQQQHQTLQQQQQQNSGAGEPGSSTAGRSAGSFYVMLKGALHLTSALKKLLVVCLEEGTYVVDSELLHMQKEVEQIRKSLRIPGLATSTSATGSTAVAIASASGTNIKAEIGGVKRVHTIALPVGDDAGPIATAAGPDSTQAQALLQKAAPGEGNEEQVEEEEVDLTAMLLPPIMTVIEEVKHLEKELKLLEKEYCGGSTVGAAVVPGYARDSLSSVDSDGSCSSSGGSFTTTTRSTRLTECVLSSTAGGEDRGANIATLQKENEEDVSFDEEEDLVSFEAVEDLEQDLDCSFLESEAVEVEDAIAFYMQQGQQPLPPAPPAAAAPAAVAAQSINKAALLKAEQAVLAQERQTTRAVALKEAEMVRMNTLTDKYESTIKGLMNEISQLEKDQDSLALKTKITAPKKVSVALPRNTSAGGAATSTTTTTTMKTKTINSAGGGLTGTNPSSTTGGDRDDARFKRELKEKSRQLEEKMKLLRAKESEFGKINTQKARLAGEVESMKSTVEEHKRQRADLQRKLRSDAAAHQQERQLLKHSEVQSRRRELQAQQSVVKLENQLQSKERVWRSQIESRDRQQQRLSKQLLGHATSNNTSKSTYSVLNRCKASVHASTSKSTNSGASVTSTTSATGGVGGVSTKEAMEVKLWVDQELQSHRQRCDATEQVTKEMLLRSQTVKRLQEARALNGSNAAAATAASSTASSSLVLASSEQQAHLKALENEIRARSTSIAALNNTLVELGSKSVADKKRFAGWGSDLRRAKLVSSVLFDTAHKAQRKEQLMTRRVRHLQEQLQRTRKQLESSNAEVAFYQRAADKRRLGRFVYDDEEDDDDDEDGMDVDGEMDETFYPSDDDDDDDDDASTSGGKSESEEEEEEKRQRRPSTNNRKAVAAAKPGATHGSKRVGPTGTGAAPTSSKRRRVSINTGTLTCTASYTSKGGRGTENNNENSIDNISSDADHDDDDEEEDDDDDDDEDDSMKERKQPLKKNLKQATTATVNVDFSTLTRQPLCKYTVKELKAFLAAKGLPVSGVKDELVKRLEAHLALSSALPAATTTAAATTAGAAAASSAPDVPLAAVEEDTGETAIESTTASVKFGTVGPGTCSSTTGSRNEKTYQKLLQLM